MTSTRADDAISSKSIPKIIHVIWAGGKDIMEPEGIENTVNWALLNPGFEIWLWTDSVTTPQERLNTYEREFNKINQRINVINNENKSTDFPEIKPTDEILAIIKIKDIHVISRTKETTYNRTGMPLSRGFFLSLLHLEFAITS